MKKKIILITSCILGAILLLSMIAVLTFKAIDAIKYGDFYGKAEKEFFIPGLMDGFVPQGFDYVEEEKVFLMCGYMTSGASRVYVIDKDGDHHYYVELLDGIGGKYVEHTGGIAYYGDYIYITGTDGIDVFSFDEIISGKVKATPKLGSIDTSKYDLDPAFCFIYDGQLFTGSFHDGGAYKDPEKHKINFEGRDNNNAIMLSFDLLQTNKASNYYVANTPSAIYSLPDKVQGICVTDDGNLVLSTSYGISPSNIYVHSMEKVKGDSYQSRSEAMIGVSGIPLYVIDSKTLVDTIVAPPMSEELVYLDGKIFIMNESASNKYIFGKLTTGNYLFSYKYPQVTQ